MAMLMLLRWQPPAEDKYGDLDIIQLFDADQSPGTEVVANNYRNGPVFAFVYVTDRDHDEPAVLDFMARHTSGSGQTEVTLNHRKWQMVRASIPGDVTRFLTYHPWNGDGATVPNDVKYTSAQILGLLRDKSV